MRIVHIIDSGGYYGAEVMLVHLCNAQKALGMDIEVISIGTPGSHEKPIETKLRENNIACKPWRMRALPDLRQSLKILAYCRETSTQVIHSHGYKGNILLGLVPQRWRGVAIIATLHGYTQQKGFSKLALYQWLDRQCLKRLNAVVLVSEGMRHQINVKKLGDKLHVIANGIPEEIPEAANQPIPHFKEGDFKIAAIGRLSHEKNFQLLIKAMPLVLEKVPNAKLVIFGEGTEREYLESLIDKLSLNKSVTLPGYIDEPSRVYRHADVFVNCSITEGMPITLLESMREGCPIIATNIPANRALIENISPALQLVELSEYSMSHAILVACDKKHLKDEKSISQFSKKLTSIISAKYYKGLYSMLRKEIKIEETI